MNKSSWGSSVIFKRVKECRDHKVWANILVLCTSSSLSVKQRQDRYYRVRARIKLETVWKSPKIVTCTKQVVVILSLYLFDLFIWSTDSTGKTVVAESGRLLRRLRSGNPFCFDSLFLTHYLSIFFFSVLNLKAFQLDMFSPDDQRFHDLVALFTCLLSLVGCKLLVMCSLQCEAGSDPGTENAPGISQQRLKNALTVMVPAPGLQQYLKGTSKAMRVGLWAVVHCILHYTKCPPRNWSLVIAFLTLGSPGGSELPAAQETGVQSLVRKIAWGRECNPLQDSCLENFMDRGAWRATVHVVAKSRTRLSDSHFLSLIYLLNFSPIKNIQPPLNSKIHMGTVKSKFGVTAT